MITSNLMLCAEGIVHDAAENNISVYSILEDIAAVGFPFYMQKIFSCTYILREANDPQVIHCELKIKNNDLELHTVSIKVDFEDKMRNRSIVRINALVVQNPGILKFSFLHDGRELNSYAITVNLIKEPEAKTS